MRVSWPEFSEELEDCRKCRLCEHRSHIVPGEGNPNAALMFIGEGPGQEEDRLGRPFVGRSGELLTRMIHAIGIERFADRRSILAKRSWRSVRVTSRETAEARRLAITLPSSASAEHSAIAPPQSQTVPRLPVGATSSMMWERIHGMARSMTVPTNLMAKPTSIAP